MNLDIKQKPEKEKYYYNVHKTTNKQPIHILENFDKRGRFGYHLDHIIPISHGFKNNIKPEIIGNIDNLQFLPWLENIKKGDKV